MEAAHGPESDDFRKVDLPSHSDRFVRGLSEAIGGPLGEHAACRAGWLVASGPPHESCSR